MITGSDDFVVRLWDFHGMTKKMNSFRQVEPSENQQIRALSYSPNGTNFLVCTQGNQPGVFTRDGKEVVDCVRGDMYIRDLAHTKGHTSMVTDGQWHPHEKHIFATSSLDSTVRLWDLTTELYGIDRSLKNSYIIKCLDKRGKKV